MHRLTDDGACEPPGVAKHGCIGDRQGTNGHPTCADCIAKEA